MLQGRDDAILARSIFLAARVHSSALAAFHRRPQDQPKPPESICRFSTVVLLSPVTDICHGANEICEFRLDFIVQVRCGQVMPVGDAAYDPDR